MAGSIGPLVPADEQFNHQIVETFASVGQSDPACSERPLHFDKLSETGFYLGAGHYHGGDGHFHGSWRGELLVDGDYVEDASQPAVIERYTQFRDCMIRVEDPVGGGVGWGNCQTYVHGAWPGFGLHADQSQL